MQDGGRGNAVVVTLHDRVQLYDTDASGLIFFGAATRWLTNGQFALLEHLGRPMDLDSGTTTPVRALSIEYDGPLRVREAFVQEVWVDEVGRTSFTVATEIMVGGEVRVRGRTTHVNVRLADLRPVPVPPEIVAAARRSVGEPPAERT